MEENQPVAPPVPAEVVVAATVTLLPPNSIGGRCAANCTSCTHCSWNFTTSWSSPLAIRSVNFICSTASKVSGHVVFFDTFHMHLHCSCTFECLSHPESELLSVSELKCSRVLPGVVFFITTPLYCQLQS